MILSNPRLGRVMAALGRWLSYPLIQSYLIGPIALVLILALRRFGLVSNLPLWVYTAALLGPTLPSTAANLIYFKVPGRLGTHIRAASDSLATTVAIYATGWGPAAGVTYLVAAQQLVSMSGADAWKITRRWSLAGIAAGQLAITVGWVPSLLSRHLDNGVGIIGAFGFVLVSRMAETISVDRERAWERLRSLIHNSSDMIVVLQPGGEATYASGACERILGMTADEVVAATDLSEFVHPDDLQPVRQYLLEALEAPEPTRPVEMRVRHRNGQWRDVEAVGSNQNDNPAVGGIVLNVRDVTERRRAEAELAHSATHDALTGLPNRALFMSRLAHRLQQREARAPEPAVMFLDIDRFKMINDSLGHDVGDQLLVEAARRLRAALPPVDTVARFGGDEFVILCEEATDPADLARRLLAVFDKPFRLAGDDYHLSASLGVSYPDRPAAEPAELVRDADTAMYRAKEQGRGRLHMFDEAARAAAVGRAHTEHLLRNAIDRDELRLFYQPIIDMRTGAVVAAEALIRWNHPRLGLIGPDQFIGTAEDSGLIVAIGEWVLDQALAQARVWADRGAAIDMAINVSGRQLNDDDFVTTVDRLIKQYGDPDRASLQVTLEVTESVLIHDPDTIAQRLGQIKQSGIRLSMDDFGTGYSSLSNLRRLPFDTIKIDRLFVGGVTNSFDDGTIVRAIIALAHSLGRTVVAEGVETQEQLDLLRALGCDRAQGYHIGRPAPATPVPHQLRIDRPELPGGADHRTGMVDGARS